MKDYIVLEINGKKKCLSHITIETPNKYLLVDNTQAILNNRIFEEFIDGIFWFTVDEFAHEFDKKIDNVFITFIDDYDELVCSIVIDKFKPKRGVYRMRVFDWKVKGYTLKFVEDNLDDSDILQ